MIKLMLKQIWNERKSNAWLWVELLIVFVALWIVVDWTYVNLHTYLQPRGFNAEHTYKMNFNQLTPQSKDYISPEQNTRTAGEEFLAVIDRLRHHPDIEYVSCSRNASPYNGSNSFYVMHQDSGSVERLIRPCTPDFFNVFQYQNADGTGSASLAEAFEKNTIIAARNFWEERFPDGKNLLGQKFYQNSDTLTAYRVSAVTMPVHYSDFDPDFNYVYYAGYMSQEYLASLSSSDYVYVEVCVRVRPGASPDFAEKLMKDSSRLYNVGNCYIQNIRSFDDIRHSYQLDTVNALKKRAFIMLFLLVNIFLGIIGTFWYRTQQRRAELGLRIALGSSLPRLNTLLIGEGLLLLLLAAIPALIVCYNVGKADLTDAWQMEWGIARFVPGVLITLLLMVFMIMVGIWYPAYQAMKIRPAEALHED